MFVGVGGLLILILDIFCIMQVVQSSMDGMKKLIWILLILFLPLLGPILWLLIGRGGA
ncbi:MAG: PLDc N-terminal domain-containing protein [Anaerolineae bacterium]|nr:PLDc N-terminal domain-containing protein [Phycisphaerae bacterium]